MHSASLFMHAISLFHACRFSVSCMPFLCFIHSTFLYFLMNKRWLPYCDFPSAVSSIKTGSPKRTCTTRCLVLVNKNQTEFAKANFLQANTFCGKQRNKPSSPKWTFASRYFPPKAVNQTEFAKVNFLQIDTSQWEWRIRPGLPKRTFLQADTFRRKQWIKPGSPKRTCTTRCLVLVNKNQIEFAKVNFCK